MNTAEFYRAVALGLPFLLVGVSRAAPHRWACTIMATIYTLFQLALAWVLSLSLPAAFPLLLIGAAVALDLARPVPGVRHS